MKKEKKERLSQEKFLRARRDYKDTLFRMIFDDRENLLNLFNAVNNTDYKEPEDLKVVTLDNAIYMNMKNDLAFIIDFQLNLYEHQSSYNPNMPLRNLLYVAREYQKLVKERSVYSSAPLKIPTPHFVVFYNGEREEPERRILKLSDLFELKADHPELELQVTVLNINFGHNGKLLESCPLLKEYMLYVERVRNYTKIMGLNRGVEQAVGECIEEGILAEFLSNWKAEAIAVSIFEYNAKRERKLWERDQREYLRAQVKEEMREEIRDEVRAEVQKEVRAEVQREVRAEVQKEVRAEIQADWAKRHRTGREEGRIQGIIATGTLLGISKEQILKILCTQMSITKEQAEDYLEQEQHAAL